MTSHISHVVQILSRSERSPADLELLDSVLSLMRDMQQYAVAVTKSERWRLYRTLRVEVFEQGEEVFSKGDASEKMFIVLEGAVVMWKSVEEGRIAKLAVLDRGRILGERGLLRSAPRTMSATAEERTILATLDKEHFKAFLEPIIAVRMDDKLQFLDDHIPGLRQLVSSTKDQLAFALHLLFFRRGQVIIEQGTAADYLYFICAGECAVTTERHIIVKLGAGCWFGGESLSAHCKSEFSVTAVSDTVSVYLLHRSDSSHLLPTESQFRLIEQYRKRVINWRAVARQFKSPIKLPPVSSLFPQATAVARKHLVDLSMRRETQQEQKIARSTAYLRLRKKLMWNREVADVHSIPAIRSLNSSPRRIDDWDN